MAQLGTDISPRGAAFQANRAHMEALVARVGRSRAAPAPLRARPRSGSKAAGNCSRASASRCCSIPARRSSKSRRWPGYRLDRSDPEKSIPGGGVIAGIGFVSGVRAMISASDSGIAAGALQPMGLEKQLRVQELALENKLPFIQLVESAGANLLAYKVEHFVHGGNLFRNLALMSAAGLPVVTVTHGSSTAGGAYQTGLSDYIIMVRGRTRAFLAGPPLLKAATGEIATEEELGGAEMHTGDIRPRRLSRRRRPRRDPPRSRGDGGHRLGARERRKARLRRAGLRSRGVARHHAGRLPHARRHARGHRAHRRRVRLHRIRRPLRRRDACAGRRASAAGRSASSPTTGRSIPPAPPRRRISSKPAVRPARRCSISTTPPASWSASVTRRTGSSNTARR